MDLKREYRKQADSFCKQANMVSGEEMLGRIRQELSTGEEDPSGRIRVKHTGKLLIFIAACFAALSMTLTVAAGAAGHGPFADLFRQIFHDETTAQIVEEGCLYEIRQSASDGVFTADWIAVTGDETTPKILLDITINDAAIAAENDIIGVSVYTLGVHQYEHELDQYGTCDGLAYKDAAVPNLYHASIIGASAWMCYEEEFVLDVSYLIFGIDDEITEKDKYMSNLIDFNLAPYLYDEQHEFAQTHMEFRMTLPSEAFRRVKFDYYDSVFPADGLDYHMQNAEFGAYRTDISFRFGVDDLEQFKTMENPYDVEASVQEIWLDFADDLILTVDGTQYTLAPENYGYVWYDVQGECGNGRVCYVWVSFPAINYENAQIISLSDKTTSFNLKG